MNTKIKTLNENKTIDYKLTRIKFKKFKSFLITSQPFIMKISTFHHESNL